MRISTNKKQKKPIRQKNWPKCYNYVKYFVLIAILILLNCNVVVCYCTCIIFKRCIILV